MNLDITNNNPICIIRVDGHSDVGFGHLSRTKTIAESLENEDIRCIFAITEKTISSSANAIISKFETIALSGNETLASKLTKNRTPAPAVLLIDHYGDGRKELLDSYFSDTLRVLIDDTSFHNKFCDLFINPNGFPNTSHEVAGCSLFGPKYMPVSENIASLAGTWRANHTLSKPPICLISLGATDPNAISIEILNSLSKIEVSRKFEFKILLSNASKTLAHTRDFMSTLQSRLNLKLISNKVDLSQLYVQAHCCIGASGVSAWERAIVGLPCALVLTASNQKLIKDYLTEQKAVFPIEKLNSKQLNLKLERFLELAFLNAPEFLAISNKSKKLLDGKGARRISNSIVARIRKS
ncbi:MAG: hypothetical protein CMM15_06275 [Rhodospirillaceae bacterium]|nr:hypothetical protein [Rhodospirillaceae bacterium]